jgi:type IV pilus assembly protein PilV
MVCLGRHKGQKGFTLIEVMIAMVILATGLLALMGLQIVSIRSNAFSNEMAQASILAQTRLEEIRNKPYASLATGSTVTVLPANETGIVYTVTETISDEGIPAANTRTITCQIDWKGASAGSSGGATADFTSSFTTVVTNSKPNP